MSYTPERGDLIWLNFSSQEGHEQKSVRPALVISPLQYNKKTGLAICCPVTASIKGYPFEVLVSGKKINGAILVDHLKNIEWRVRKAKFIEKANSAVMAECLGKISVLILQGEGS